MHAGQVIDGYQLIDQAPVDFIRGSHTRPVNGRLVTGSWSDPWWGYSPEKGWAVIKRWKNKEHPATRWSEFVPATDTLVIERWKSNEESNQNS